MKVLTFTPDGPALHTDLARAVERQSRILGRLNATHRSELTELLHLLAHD